ncbi:MAG: Smr/MutS family protein [Pyrinomonadaceae bacterium]
MNEPEYLDLNNPFPEPFEMEITDTLDLHAFSPKDVKSVTETYLQEAYKKGFRIVKIIHGKGIGVQREIVRKVLAETTFVKSFKNAPEFSSGQGATIAELK